jgi:hypothetical protein
MQFQVNVQATVSRTVHAGIQSGLQAFVPPLTERMDDQATPLTGNNRQSKGKSIFPRSRRSSAEDAYDGDTEIPKKKARGKKNPQENAFHVRHQFSSQISCAHYVCH